MNEVGRLEFSRLAFCYNDAMDVEKTIEFLLGNQASFDARLAQLDARIARLVEVQVNLAEEQVNLAEVQSHDHEMIVALTGAVRELADAQKRSDERAKAAEQELREDLARVANNVDSLVKIVDDWIRRNGGGDPRPL
jgi:hypothetical protein